MGAGPHRFALLLRPSKSSRAIQIGADGVGQVDQVVHVGGRVGELRVRQRSDLPLGEAVPPGHLAPEVGLGEGAEAGRAVPGKTGGDLGVEQAARSSAAGTFQDLQVLIGGVGDHDPWATEHVAQSGHVDGQGVDERHLDRFAGAVGPGQLEQGQRGPVGALPVELGIQGVSVGLAGRGLDQIDLKADSPVISVMPASGLRKRSLLPGAGRCLQPP